MAMGSTQKVVLNDEMTKAKGVCNGFRSEVATFFTDLDSTVTTLLSEGFRGEAADGFKEFYDKNVKAFFEKGGTFDLFLSMFDKDGEGLFDSIDKALIATADSLDPALGANNKSVGQQQTDAPTA